MFFIRQSCATCGASAFLLGATQLIFIYNFFNSVLRGPKAEPNPWHANTLEWTTDSPPPHGN